MPIRNYPATVTEVLDDNLRFRTETVVALRWFKEHVRRNRLHAHDESRIEAMKLLVEKLSNIYRIPVPEIEMESVTGRPGGSGSSSYEPERNRIILRGRLSVITLLHEFAHVLGKDERKACRWSINLYRLVYPEIFERLMHRNGNGRNGHFLSA